MLSSSCYIRVGISFKKKNVRIPCILDWNYIATVQDLWFTRRWIWWFRSWDMILYHLVTIRPQVENNFQRPCLYEVTFCFLFTRREVSFIVDSICHYFVQTCNYELSCVTSEGG